MKNELENDAAAIMETYGLEMSPPWEGRAEVLHMWHGPTLSYLVTYEEYCVRIPKIMGKPEYQRLIRLRSIRRVQWESTPAYAELERAEAKWWHVHGVRAYDFAYEEWLREDARSIRRIHEATCHGDCTWDEERREMTFVSNGRRREGN